MTTAIHRVFTLSPNARRIMFLSLLTFAALC